MINILRYTEYLYLAVAIVSVYKIVTLWETAQEDTYLFIFFAIVSIGMFLFRRNYRKRFEKRRDQNKE